MRGQVGGALAAMVIGMLLSGCQGSKGGKSAGEQASAVGELQMNTFAVAWRADVPMRGEKSSIKKLVLSEDRVYTYLSDNYCYWLNRVSGRVVAATEAARPKVKLFDAVTLIDRVIFPSSGELTICDRKGKFLHKVALQYEASSNAVGSGMMLFVAIDHPNGGRLAAIRTDPQPYTITPKWELMTRAPIVSSPAFYQDLVYVGSRDGGVYAVRADNRIPLWPGIEGGVFKTDGEILADLKADKDGVYVASTDSKLYCLDLNTGRIRWTYYTGRLLDESCSLVTTSQMVFVNVPGVGMAAIDKTGRVEIRAPKWVVAEARQFLAADERNVYLLAADKSILAVDKTTGHINFRSAPTAFTAFVSNTSSKDSLIYAALPGGSVYAIRPVVKPGTIGEAMPVK